MEADTVNPRLSDFFISLKNNKSFKKIEKPDAEFEFLQRFMRITNFKRLIKKKLNSVDIFFKVFCDQKTRHFFDSLFYQIEFGLNQLY
jgi:hypothetical protein